MNLFITAIGTDSGKTLVSAIIAQALNAAYWKPIQCGTPTDSETLKNFTASTIPIIPPRYDLITPASPHHAAAMEGVHIKVSDFSLPKYDSQHLVIEGAGGILVPLNDKENILDLAKHLADGVIIVSNYYLGSINHTLLTIQACKQAGLPILGLVFNGDEVPGTKQVIETQSGLSTLFSIPRLESINHEIVVHQAALIKNSLLSALEKA